MCFIYRHCCLRAAVVLHAHGAVVTIMPLSLPGQCCCVASTMPNALASVRLVARPLPDMRVHRPMQGLSSATKVVSSSGSPVSSADGHWQSVSINTGQHLAACSVVVHWPAQSSKSRAMKVMGCSACCNRQLAKSGLVDEVMPWLRQATAPCSKTP